MRRIRGAWHGSPQLKRDLEDRRVHDAGDLSCLSVRPEALRMVQANLCRNLQVGKTPIMLGGSIPSP